MSEEQKPYRIQWAQSSEYDIVGPEGKTPRSWLKTEAENIAQWMNHAYAAGLAAKDAELARLRGELLDAQSAFVELWGVASGAEERFIDDTEALEWVDKFARKHDDKVTRALTAALPSPAEAVNGSKHHACDLLPLLDSDRAEAGENCAECLTLVAKLAKYESAPAEAGDWNTRAPSAENAELKRKLAEAEKARHPDHSHCITPCDSIRIQGENHSAFLLMKERAEVAERKLAELEEDIDAGAKAGDDPAP